MITISDVWQSFTESQREVIYELVGKAALDGDYDHDLYHRTQYVMSENQKYVMEFFIKLALDSFENWRKEK